MQPQRTTLARFWAKVDQGAPNGCWEWIAGKSVKGYGSFNADGASVRAHRFAYELLVGPIPEGFFVDHLCRNHACVNPAHLEAVTPKENVLRGTSFAAVNARKTHCIHGHPLVPGNLCLHRKLRECLTCRKEYRRHQRVKAKAAREAAA